MSDLIRDLSFKDLQRHSRHGALLLDTGAVTTRISLALPEAVAALQRNYGAFPLLSGDVMADFRASVHGTGGFRRWFRRQAAGDFGIPLPAAMAAVTLEMALNWCVATRANWLLIFHAAVVEKGGRALVLPGDTGQGKSTLCAALVAAGWRLLSDEFCLFDLATGRIHPNVRPISLKNESVGVIRERAGADVLSPPIEGTPKGTIAYWPPKPEDVERRHESALPLAVIFPYFQPQGQPAIETLPKARAFIRVVASSVNYELHGETAFRAMGDFIDRHPTYEMIYPDLDSALALIARISEPERRA